MMVWYLKHSLHGGVECYWGGARSFLAVTVVSYEPELNLATFQPENAPQNAESSYEVSAGSEMSPYNNIQL